MPEANTLNQAISLISFGISSFLSFFLFVSPSEKSASRILSFLMALYSIVFFARYIVTTRSDLSIFIPFFVIPAVFLYGPGIYFYTRASLFHINIQKSEYIKIFIACAFGFLIFLSLFSYFPEFRNPKQIFSQDGNISIFSKFFISLGDIYCIFFTFKSNKLISVYEKEFESAYASDALSRLNWIKTFLKFNFLIQFIYAIIFILQLLNLWKFPMSPVEGIITVWLHYQILYYLIQKPVIFHLEKKMETIISAPENLASKPVEENVNELELVRSTKYLKQSLTEEERKNYLNKIQTYMKEAKPYLEEELSLNDIAAKLKIPLHHFSMTINIELRKNFFNFVSSYRVEEAKQLLSDPKNNDSTILNIAFRSGFQSKAAFNKAFKEETGLTPTDYREKFISQ